MKNTDYGAWVVEFRDGQEVWYPEGDTSFLPKEDDIIVLDFYLDGEIRNHFRLIGDGDFPYDLEVWNKDTDSYLSCAVVYTFNVWDRIMTSKRLSLDCPLVSL